MSQSSPPPADLAAYIAATAPGVRPILREFRRVVRAAAPDAEEVISYRMPAFRQNGILLYFAAFKHHIGVFPPVSGDDRLMKALESYRGPKGNLRFPLDRPIPWTLITRLVKLRVKQDLARAAGKDLTRPLRPQQSRAR